MPTTVQVDEKTLQLLNKLKEEMKARSHDEVIRALISERKRIPRSMFGANPKLSFFQRKMRPKVMSYKYVMLLMLTLG